MNPSACFFILKYNYGFGTKKSEELPAHLETEFAETEKEPPMTPAQKEHALYEFRPRLTDDEETALIRAEARKNPERFSSRPPTGKEYVMIAEDLYMVA